MELVINSGDKVTTTSVIVAEKFGKRHDNVIGDIEKLDMPREFTLLNFKEGTYSTKTGNHKMYIMTREGFMSLMMSLTGAKAAKFRADFINAFTMMEELIRKQIKDPLNHYSKRILDEPTNNLPEVYWSVFDESHSVMLKVEKAVGVFSQFDLIDGSIGKRWKSHRTTSSFGLAEIENPFSPNPPKKCMHSFKDKRGNIECACYHNSEIVAFKGWLKNTYTKEHLPKYLETKYADNVAVLDKVKQIFPKLLK
ncbi:hypothetical protein CJD36_002825 [Flavipsychrobacter stenotrophus]|uniref:BstA-like C-terminal domain-containing protein n=1 Tax=Flavipsychrobacter stenotrophus TaxID=2077091 RepID=A0A2S7T1L9_9BACT|nr:Rha family transcriptional regulator [Flavipsychrobacter stenotrophus]PQJ12695.1 hypothetical protein CJD36_002825 [Flavipsychrobacter stenotrophus]